MMNIIKSIICPKEEISYGHEESRKRLFELTESLERSTVFSQRDVASRHSEIVSIAVKIRQLLSESKAKLTHMEKVELIKAMNRAKVRTFLAGSEGELETFRVLDRILEDVRKYL